MSFAIAVGSEDIRSALIRLSREDQQLFSDTREKYAKNVIGDGPLLDQICWLRLIMIRLRENFSSALSAYEEGLKDRINKPGGWRKLRTIKLSGEFESPMPWLHPFKLAANGIQSLEEELVSAVSGGETEEKDMKRLQEIFNQYNLQFPIQPVSLKPDYMPRPTRIFK